MKLCFQNYIFVVIKRLSFILGCNTHTIVLALIETPPMLSKRNIMDLMSRLKTPVAKRSYVNEILDNETVHRYTALEFIFQDWFTRRSSTATLETLILHFKCVI